MSRVHVCPPVPHTDLTSHWATCAFTHKVWRLTQMLAAQGHDVITYASEDSEPAGELVPVITAEDRRRWFGGRTYEVEVFDRWDINDPCWAELNQQTIAAMRERVAPGDVIALTMGTMHQPIADAFPHVLAFESGVGYEGSWAPFRVFESYAWMHHTYGRQGINDGRFYDAVIPNAYDPDDFDVRDDHDGYVLFLGRHIERKGTAVVAEIAKHYDVVTAGQGEPIEGCEHVGVVRGDDKRKLIAGARVLLAPTLYCEPFGGVAVEAQLSGVPVVASPWGAFSETVKPGVTGFLPHTLGGFLDAIDSADGLDRRTIRERAVARWSLDAVAPQYGRYLDQLATLRGDGWYSL